MKNKKEPGHTDYSFLRLISMCLDGDRDKPKIWREFVLFLISKELLDLLRPDTIDVKVDEVTQDLLDILFGPNILEDTKLMRKLLSSYQTNQDREMNHYFDKNYCRINKIIENKEDKLRSVFLSIQILLLYINDPTIQEDKRTILKDKLALLEKECGKLESNITRLEGKLHNLANRIDYVEDLCKNKNKF